jgi:hypothetical protein
MATECESKLNNQTSIRNIKILAVLILVILSLIIFSNGMTKPVGRDEHMYCTGGVLMSQGKMIYRDFSYIAQLPYHPLLYATFYKLLGTTHYLLVGRLVSIVCDILVMLCIVGVYYYVFVNFRAWGILFGLCAAVLYVYNPVVDYANGYAWNNDVVVLCVALCFLLFIKIDLKRKDKPWRIAVIGILLTTATFMRMTIAVIELLFFIMLLSLPAKNLKERFGTILPFLIAAAIVSIYPIFIIARAPKAAFINIFKIHTINSQWLRQIGIFHDRFDLALESLTSPGYFVLLIIAAFLVVAFMLLRHKLKISCGRCALLAVFLPLVLLAIAMILPTTWRQYFAPPVPFLIIAFAYPLACLTELSGGQAPKIPIKIGAALMILGMLVAFLACINITKRISISITPQAWVPMQIHDIAMDIAKKTKEPKLILTTAPLFALEGGCEIYTEFSAGVFIYRIADFMSEQEQHITNTVGPKNLTDVVKRSPPSAVIVGIEPPYFSFLEKPLVSLAGTDWKKEVYENGPTVYFKP